MVRKLKKLGVKILEEMTGEKCDLNHMAIGVAGEAGELLDCVKKHTIYNHELLLENLVEELGDLEFYMEGIRQIVNVTREETLVYNMKKLGVRYRNFKYTDKRAKLRKDKTPRANRS